MALVELSDERREKALRRFEVLEAHLHDGVALGVAAAQAGVAPRTARRWLAAYRSGGLTALAPAPRADRGQRRTEAALVELIEGLALRRPAPPVAYIHRQVSAVAAANGWPAPGYATVYAIVRAVDPGLLVLAHDGPVRYRERFELVYRREAERPNEIWQADHTQLDLLIVDERGRSARPWLTVIEDDHSRAIAGYVVFLAAPSALQTALALHQAIWRKPQSAWPVCGIPDILYTDHGSDFTSQHLEQVCADLHVRLVHSTAGVPQGRGKLERLFGTIASELLCGLPGQLPAGSSRPVTPPALSLAAFDHAIERFLVEDYNQRAHSETRAVPAARWAARGWLPRMPDSLEQLDLLLLTVARPRVVQRDGIRFAGQRYLDLTLADYVGEPVTIRYDPRDVGEIRVYHDDEFVCRAVSPELARQTISLKDLQQARTSRRRALAAQLADRRRLAEQLVPRAPYADRDDPGPPPTPAPRPVRAPRPRLALYREQ